MLVRSLSKTLEIKQVLEFLSLTLMAAKEKVPQTQPLIGSQVEIFLTIIN